MYTGAGAGGGGACGGGGARARPSRRSTTAQNASASLKLEIKAFEQRSVRRMHGSLAVASLALLLAAVALGLSLSRDCGDCAAATSAHAHGGLSTQLAALQDVVGRQAALIAELRADVDGPGAAGSTGRNGTATSTPPVGTMVDGGGGGDAGSTPALPSNPNFGGTPPPSAPDGAGGTGACAWCRNRTLQLEAAVARRASATDAEVAKLSGQLAGLASSQAAALRKAGDLERAAAANVSTVAAAAAELGRMVPVGHDVGSVAMLLANTALSNNAATLVPTHRFVPRTLVHTHNHAHSSPQAAQAGDRQGDGHAGRDTYFHIVTPLSKHGGTMYRFDVVGHAYGAARPIDIAYVGYTFSGADTVVSTTAFDRNTALNYDAYQLSWARTIRPKDPPAWSCASARSTATTFQPHFRAVLPRVGHGPRARPVQLQRQSHVGRHRVFLTPTPTPSVSHAIRRTGGAPLPGAGPIRVRHEGLPTSTSECRGAARATSAAFLLLRLFGMTLFRVLCRQIRLTDVEDNRK